MTKQALDLYDDIPRDMKKYLSHYGWHFNKKACEYAVKLMKRISPATGKLERIDAFTKEQVEDILKKYNVVVDTGSYDFVYVANRCKADYLKSSIPDEHHLALYVKDVIEDGDAGDGAIMRMWYASMVAKGQMVDWEEIL